MIQRLVLTIFTACSLTGLYLAYSAVMRPIVVIPDPIENPLEKDDTEVKRPYENTRVASKYLSASPWSTATVANYMLRAEEGFIFTDSWKHDEDNNKRVIFEPFAIVWLMKDKQGQEQAISVVSKKAMLEFALKFDEKQQNTGRIVGAVLNGPVDIAGPDGLLVQGSDFHFEEEAKRLYTQHPVTFQYLAHKGSATKMEMKLIPADGPPGKDRPHIFGIESIHLSGRPNPDDPNNRYVWLKMQVPQGNDVRTVLARCSDELTYTVATNTAVMTTDVIAKTGINPYVLECDKLTMQFAPKGPVDSDDVGDSGSRRPDDQPRNRDFQKIETNLEFSWLEAVEGRKSPVKIRSKSNGIIATMARLTYNEETRSIFMSSDDTGDDSENVRTVEVTRHGSTLKVPSIKIDLDEEKKNIDSLICLGQGELKYFDETTGRLNYVAAWQHHLRKFTDAMTRLDLVELEGNAQFRQPKPDPKYSSGVQAERIKIWLAPLNFSLPAEGSSSAPSDAEPKRILAEHEVRLKSPQLLITRTDELDIQFEDDATVQHLSSEIEPASRQRLVQGVPMITGQLLPLKSRSQLLPAQLTLSDSQASTRHTGARNSPLPRPVPRQVGFASIKPDPLGTLGPPVEIPFHDPSGAQRQKMPADPLRSMGRTSVSADRIEVKVRRVANTQELQPRAVVAQGKVNISQERQPKEKPLTLVGDRVDMQIETQEKLIAHVQGAPALIRDRQFEIEGRWLHLDRAANRAWVDGSGLLKLPIPAERPIPGMDPAAARDLIVRWDESMNFNGLQAEFLGNVEAKLGHATMTCGQMTAQLVQAVSFQQENLASEPELKSIRCRERVHFKNSAYKDKNLIEVYRGRVGDFTLNYAAGTVEAQGPGEVFAWQKHNKNGGISSREAIQANRPITTEVTVWDYTHLQFEGQLKGSSKETTANLPAHQHVVVTDRVEIIYGPVKWIIDQIDPDNLPSMAGTMRCGRLEFDNYPVSENNPVAYRTFVGRENSEVEGQVDGRRFTAAADEISFDESKSLYKIRSYGRQNARLTGMSSNTLMGRQIEFNPDPKLRMLKVERAVEGQGSP